MIVQENFELNGVQFTKTYSDRGVMIHGGFPEGDYSEAIDPISENRTYIETDIPIEDEAEADEILNIIMGVEK